MNCHQTFPLKDLSILIVEDEPLVAMALADQLECAQAQVIGPVASVAQAIDILRTHTPDAALLDINLNGLSVGPAADLLHERGIPFMFATAVDRDDVPERFASIPICAKPMPAAEVVSMLAHMVCRAP